MALLFSCLGHALSSTDTSVWYPCFSLEQGVRFPLCLASLALGLILPRIVVFWSSSPYPEAFRSAPPIPLRGQPAPWVSCSPRSLLPWEQHSPEGPGHSMLSALTDQPQHLLSWARSSQFFGPAALGARRKDLRSTDFTSSSPSQCLEQIHTWPRKGAVGLRRGYSECR